MATARAARRLSPASPDGPAFTLRVQTGCAEPCSYCIIPATRGRPRSVAVETVLAEVDRVAGAGFKEIALTGVHLGSYGRDLAPASSLVQLLCALDSGGLRDSRSVRSRTFCFGSARSSRWTARGRVVDLVADGGCFAPHFHLPLQHASNRMLSAMRRPYTIEYYASLVDDIRARMPHASIGSDVIVGFPGETDEDFDAARVVSRALAADARPRVSVLGSPGHRRDVDERQSGRVRLCASADAGFAKWRRGWPNGSGNRRWAASVRPSPSKTAQRSSPTTI